MVTSFESTLIVEHLDGTTYDLGHEGIRVITFDPPSPNYQHTYAQFGHYGVKRTNTVIQQMVIPLTFDVYAENNYDYELQRLKVMQIFDSQSEFYIYNVRMPYLRWRVIAQTFNYPRLSNYWRSKNVAVNLDCPSGFAETSVSSLHLLDHDKDYVGFGLGLKGNDLPEYIFKDKTSFNVQNIGRIPLLANEHPVTIHFKGEASNGLTIHNKTTDQTFKYLKPLTSKDEFKLVGLIPIVNGKQRLGNAYSSRSWLDLTVGNNLIELVGAHKFTISFETRFYF